MEVAVNMSTRRITQIVCIALLSGSFLLAGGCKGPILPDNARTQGMKLYRGGHYADAAGAFQNAVRKDPTDYTSYYYLGASYYAMTSYQQAMQAYRSSLDNFKWTQEGRTDADFRLKVLDGLASAIAKSASRDAEIDHIKAAMQANSSAEDYVLLAKINRKSGDADAALEQYSTAMMREPTNFRIAKEYGLYLEQLSQTQQAESILRRAYQLNPSDKQVADALRRLGIIPGPSLLHGDAVDPTPVSPAGNTGGR
jgi:tetratricopeptide (TPR) repeat protein